MVNSNSARMSYAAVLEGCHHEPAWATLSHVPRVGEVVWCRFCQAERKVESILGKWRAKCDSCRYSRSFGVVQLTASLAGGKHARGHAGHKVTIWQVGRERHAYAVEMNVPLPTGTDAPF